MDSPLPPAPPAVVEQFPDKPENEGPRMNLPLACGDRSSAGRRLSCQLTSIVSAVTQHAGPAPVTCLIAVAALLLQSFPTIQPTAELFFADLTAKEAWRLATCHLLHWSWDHFFWDVMVLVAAGAFCETHWPRRFHVVLAIAGAVIPLAVMISAPELLSYRGLSGLDSALFALAAGSLLIEQLQAGQRSAVLLVAVVVAAQFFKIGLESTVGNTLFVQDAPFVPVPLAHLCGAAIGSLGAATGARREMLKVVSAESPKKRQPSV